MGIERRSPTLDEFRTLASSVGWLDHFDWSTMQGSLDGSLFSVVATEEGHVVGTGRVVGDGVRYFYLQDVMVSPAHAENGIATQLVGELLAWILVNAAPKAFIGLFSSPDAEGVYEQHGFSAADDMTGMRRLIG